MKPPAPETTIRPATAQDVAAILPLWRELMELHANLDSQFRLAPDAAAQVEAHLYAGLDRPDLLCLVAVRHAAVVGYCRASVREHSSIFEQRTHGFVSELHVHPTCQRQGVGRELFEAVRRWLAGQGVRRLEVVTLHANGDSRGFWQSVGCKPGAERRFLEFDGV